MDIVPSHQSSINSSWHLRFLVPVISPWRSSQNSAILVGNSCKRSDKMERGLLTKLFEPDPVSGGLQNILEKQTHFQSSNQRHHCQPPSYRHHKTFWGFVPSPPADKTAMRHLECGSSLQSVDINSNLSPAPREDYILTSSGNFIINTAYIVHYSVWSCGERRE